MSDVIQNRVIAMSGVYQCCYLVNAYATQGKVDVALENTVLSSLFVENPDDTLAVYGGDLSQLRQGLITLITQMNGTPDMPMKSTGGDPAYQVRNLDISKYAVTAIVLAKKAMQDDEVMNSIFSGIELAKHQIERFGLEHENIRASLAQTYSKTISQIPPKIMVKGSHGHLQNARVANGIRALLLASVRSGVLWRQVGGSRWDFVLKRRAYVDQAQTLLRRLSDPAH